MVKRSVLMGQQAALIACALFCDWSLESVDGDPRNFCLLSWRDGGERLAQYTSNLAGEDRLKAAAALIAMAGRLLDKVA
jgi:hypothetical protein